MSAEKSDHKAVEASVVAEKESNADQSKDTRITFKVVDQTGGEVFFSMKPTTPFRKMMSSYCERTGVDVKAIRFLYDGERIQSEQSPFGLKMENDDVIDAILTQVGGVCKGNALYFEKRFSGLRFIG